MNSLSQEEFNNEMFDAARRFITRDLDCIEEVALPYANQHRTILNYIGNDWLQVAESNTPQNYGYNGVQLKVPAAGTEVELEFKGLAKAKGYNAVKTDKEGWRYGFLAFQENGTGTYSKIFSDSQGAAKFHVLKNTSELWLVVNGTPTTR